MQSKRAFAGALVLLIGVPVAFAVALTLGDGAQAVIHLALGVSFLLIAISTLDFKPPIWVAAIAGLAIGALAVIFLLQGLSDIMRADPLKHLAYDVLGQRLEKVLGYMFLLWCLALLLFAPNGSAKIFGFAALAAIACAEAYSFAAAHEGGEAPEALKLLYLPLFVWLLQEGMKSPG